MDADPGRECCATRSFGPPAERPAVRMRQAFTRPRTMAAANARRKIEINSKSRTDPQGQADHGVCEIAPMQVTPFHRLKAVLPRSASFVYYLASPTSAGRRASPTSPIDPRRGLDERRSCPCALCQTPIKSMFVLRALSQPAPVEPHDNSGRRLDEVGDQSKRVGVPGLAMPLQLAHDRLPTYERPRLRPTLRRPQDDLAGERSRKASISSAFHAANPTRTTSTFSCDIARAVSRRLRSRRERLAPTAPRLRGLLARRYSKASTTATIFGM